VTRTYPSWIIAARLLGTIALLVAIAAVLQPRAIDPRLGPVFIAVFVVLRLGGEWLLALRSPDPEGRYRRSAILNTLIAVAVVVFWFVLRRRGGL
jgi:hypothetical protein